MPSADAAAEKIISKAGPDGQPNLPFTDLQQPETTTVPREQMAIFIVKCNMPDIIAEKDGELASRSLAKIVDDLLNRLDEKFGKTKMDSLKDLDDKLAGVLFTVIYNLPAMATPPKPEDTEVQVVQRTLVDRKPVSEAMTAMMGKLLPVENMMDTITSVLMSRMQVTTMQMCSITMVDMHGKVGGVVVANPGIPITAETGTVMYETMKNHSEEFRRNCEQRGLRLKTLITPSSADIRKVKKSKR